MPDPASKRSREPSGMPFTAASAGGVTAEASDARESPEKSPRQPCSCVVSAAGRPSTVIPLTPSASPTLPRIRTTGTAFEPPARAA